MAVVYIPHSATTAQEEAVKQVINKTLITDANWGGATIELERDEVAWIDTTDEYAGLALLKKVQRALASN